MTMLLQFVLFTLWCCSFRSWGSFGFHLEELSFKLLANLHSYSKSGRVTVFRLEEIYSFEQERAILHLKRAFQEHPNDGVFFVDTKQNISLFLSDQDASCNTRNAGELMHSIGLDAIESLDFQSTNSHIVGLAKLLVFVGQNKRSLRLDTFDRIKDVRNMQCLKYILESQTRSGTMIQLTAYFTGESLLNTDDGNRQESSTLDSLPIRIVIKQNEMNSSIIIDYSQLQLLDHQSFLMNPQQGSNVKLDPFVLFPLSQCKDALKGIQPMQLFQSMSLDSTKFSFEAIMMMATQHNEKRAFVAYDGPIRSMRVDEMDITQEAASLKFFNFKFSRLYHITLNSSPNSTGDWLNAGDSTSKNKNSCIMTSLSVSPDEPLIGELLLGGSQFVYLGKAQVDGIDANVYESSSSYSFEQLAPCWIKQQAQYSDTSTLPSGTNNNSDTNWVSLVYLADREHTQSILMIQMYSVSESNGPTIQVSMRLHNFVWTIQTPSQEQSSSSELFSLQDRCQSNDRIIQFEMLLETKNQPDNQQQADCLLDCNSRNLAILASLQDSLQLSVNLIYDLNSHLIQSSSSLVVQFKLRTDELANDDSISKKIEKHQGIGLSLNDMVFIVKRLRIHDAHSETPVTKLSGFGLDERDEKNERLFESPLRPSFTNDYSASKMSDAKTRKMTLGQCKATCLADLDCSSYSICIRAGEMICVLSKLSLESLQEQLANNKSENSLNRQTKLTKHPNCAIYSKRYLDMFTRSERPVETDLFEMSLIRVDNLEQCARICAQRSINALRNHSSFLLDHLLNPKRYNVDHVVLRGACMEFYHLRAASAVLMGSTTRMILMRLTSTDEQGTRPEYCVINSRNANDNVVMERLMLPLDRQQLNAISFYHEEVGLSLLASPESVQELEAFQEVKNGPTRPTESSIETLRAFAARGDNAQIVAHVDKAMCASLCLMQMTALWPSCKSFSIVIRNDEPIECRLNSITLDEALSNGRSDLIEASWNGSRLLHFEPKLQFSLSTKDLLSMSGDRSASFDTWEWLTLLGVVVVGIAGGHVVASGMMKLLVKGKRWPYRDSLIRSTNDLEIPTIT